MLDEASAAYLQALTDGDITTADRLRDVLDTSDILDRQRPLRLVNAAVSYAYDGIPVFPCQPRGKTPLTRHGFKDATTDTGQVAAWWAQWPDANIGLPTGHRFDVFDIDGPEGVTSMYCGSDAPADYLNILGHALTSRPAGHHLYVPPTGRSNGTRILPGVDYRARGGYVIAPPSVGANGRRYLWTKQIRDLDA